MKQIWYHSRSLIIIIFILFHVHIVNADKEISVAEEQMKLTAYEIKKDVVELMKWTSEMKAKYGVGEECFPNEDGEETVRLSAFPVTENESYQTGKDIRTDLTRKMLSDGYKEDTIEGFTSKKDKFYFISALRPHKNYCYECHHEKEDLDRKFNALGTLIITIALPKR